MDPQDFLHFVWKRQGEGFGFVSLRSSPGSWRDVAIKYPEQLGEFKMFDLDEGDIYFSPNLFERPRRRRELMLPSRWLYADLDDAHPQWVPVEPTLVWESSPDRWQCLWAIDQELEELEHGQINRQLTYACGADKGGWDSTQVLRLPGTLNHKYPDKPRVKLISYTRGYVDVKLKSLPKELLLSDNRTRSGEIFEPSEYSKEEILSNYRDVIPIGTLSRIQAKDAYGDRSRVIWAIVCTLLELGLTKAEILRLLEGTSWDKFLSRGKLCADINRAATRLGIAA